MTLGVTTADYAIRVRDGSRNLIGEVDAYDKFQAVLRFNAVSDWALQLDAAHPMAPFLATKGNGIVVTRAIRDAETRKVIQASTLLSGPVRRIERKKQGNLLIVSGKDDTMVLAARDAWPLGGLPFMASALLAGGGPARYYRLGDPAATTTPADTSLNNKPGSVAGSAMTFGQTGLVSGDPETSVNFTTTLSRVLGDTSGLNVGNNPWTLAIGVKIAGAPAGTQFITVYGNNTATNLQGGRLSINTSRQILADVSGATLITGPAIATGASHLLVLRYDGAGTLTLNVDGGAKQSASGIGTLAIPASPLMAVGAGFGGASPWAGNAQEWLFWNSAIGDADVAALWAAFSATHGAYDTRSGIASSILQAYIAADAISAVNIDRDVSGLSNGADPLAGGTVPGNERYTPLVTKAGDGVLQRLALASNPPLGFRVVQVGTNLQAQIYVPQDKTAVAKFSDDLGNLADFDYIVEAPDLDNGGNYVLVLGGGTGAGRAAYAAQDATSIAAWGRAETVVDARDTTDTPTLAARAADALASAKEKTSFSAVLAPVQSQVYGVDFNLGDKVSVTVDGATFTDIIREVQITLDPAGGETVEPAVGSPNAATVQTALANFSRDIQRVQSRVSNLERVQ